MIYIPDIQGSISKVETTPFAGSVAISQYPHEVLTNPGGYWYNGTDVDFKPETWQYTDRPVRMRMESDEVVELIARFPALYDQFKTLGMPQVWDKANKLLYVYFYTVATLERELLEGMFNAHFQNIEDYAAN